MFLIFAPKHRLWVLVRTASASHNLCFEQKNRKISKTFYRKFSFRAYEINNMYIAWASFRNEKNKSYVINNIYLYIDTILMYNNSSIIHCVNDYTLKEIYKRPSYNFSSSSKLEVKYDQ